MVTIGKSTTGLWHVLGRFGCQDADPSNTVFEKQKPLDEFEFRTSPPKHLPASSKRSATNSSDEDSPEIGYPERQVEKGIDEQFCKRCRRSISHWISLREANLLSFRVRLDDAINDQDAPGDEFEQTKSSSEAEESCDICGKPESGQWFRSVDNNYKSQFEHIVKHVCQTCYRGIREPLSDRQRETGLLRASLNEDIGNVRGNREGNPLQKPPEAPRQHEAKERKENPQTERDKAITEMANNINGLGTNGASRLYKIGIDSLETLANTNANNITSVNGVGETKAIDYVEKTREALKEKGNTAIEFSEPIRTGVCQNCSAEYPETSDMRICPNCCPHDGEIVRELDRIACRKCDSAVTQDENGQWVTKNEIDE